MKRSNKEKWGELKVGLLITLAIVVLLWASFTGSGTSIFEDKISYIAYFDNVNGLIAGAPVWIAGVEVGNVKSVKFVNLDSANQIEITIRVKQSVTNMITTDASIRLGTIGFLGDKYAEIIPGTIGKPLLTEGSAIRTEATGDISAVLSEGEDMMTSARHVMTNLDEITKRMKNGEGTLGQLATNDILYTELTSMIGSMTVLIEGLQGNQARITTAVENISVNLESVAEKANSNSGTIGKLLGDPGLYDNLHASTGRIDSILAKINQGRGTAGAMVNDDEMYQEIKNLIVRVENLVSDIEENPGRYFKFSVF